MKYMIAVDGSEPAKRALEMAASLMKEEDELLVLSVGEWEPHKFPILFDSAKVGLAGQIILFYHPPMFCFRYRGGVQEETPREVRGSCR